MFLALVITSLIAEPPAGQDDVFMYGKIVTVDEKSYEGPIRWGREEVYWVDLFNAAKQENENLRYLSERDRERLDAQQNDSWISMSDNVARWVSGRFSNHRRDYTHQFTCQFGDIKSIRPTGSQRAEIELRNGTRVEVDGEGYNDVGNDIVILDKELGEVTLRWNRIEKVEFMKTPSALPGKFGEPLYGTVEAFGKKVSGYIQWDHDERLSTDKLDGESEDGKLSIEFGKIRSIEKKGGRSIVELKSGRRFEMSGSNDVAKGHRGVIVMNRDFPAFDIPWSEFDKVTFSDNADGDLLTFSDYKNPKELNARVKTRDGSTLSGRLIFDLDEAYDFELLQGKEGEFEYTIPFRSIKKITAKGSRRSVVELVGGKTVTLDDAQDVGDRNQGLLIFPGKERSSTYIPWAEVESIEMTQL